MIRYVCNRVVVMVMTVESSSRYYSDDVPLYCVRGRRSVSVAWWLHCKQKEPTSQLAAVLEWSNCSLIHTQ